MLSFLEWNERLLQFFFHRRNRLRPVRLNIDAEELHALGGGLEDLVAAVTRETKERDRATVQDLGLLLHAAWSLKTAQAEKDGTAYEPPAHLPILVLYGLAVNHGGSRFPPHAYYDRLHDLLDSPHERIDSIRRSLPLWTGLQDWSTKRLGGQLGIFEIGGVGQQQYVGIPRRQVLLAPREEGPLRRAFSTAGISPGSNPSDRRLHEVVRKARGLLSRTRHLLSDWPANTASVELLDEIRKELETWDEVSQGDLESAGAARLPLQLLLRHRGGRIVGGQLQVASVRGLTDEDHLLVSGTGSADFLGALWLRAGEGEGPSVVVSDEDDPQIGMQAPWFDSFEIEVDGTDACLFREDSKYLILKPGNEFDTLEETCSKDLEADSPYVLVGRSGEEALNPAFVRDFRTPWRSCELCPGVIYRGFVAQGEVEEEHAPPARIRLQGGIRSSLGLRAYLPFALPEMLVELPGGSTHYALRMRTFDTRGRKLGDKTLASGSPPALPDSDPILGCPRRNARMVELAMPSHASHAGMCELELEVDNEAAASSRFFVDHSPEQNLDSPVVARDGLGQIVDDMGLAAFIGLNVLTRGEETGLDMPLAGRALESAPRLAPDLAGRRLMQLLRFRSPVSWPNVKRWLPQCLTRSERDAAGARYVSHQAQALHSLGVAELVEDPDGGLESLIALKPQLVLLPRQAHLGIDPRRGLQTVYEVLLAGCWLDDQINNLKKKARKLGLELRETGRPAGARLAPHRRTLLAPDANALARLKILATDMRVSFDDSIPLALSMVRSVSPLAALSESIRWVQGPPSEVWDTRYFDPRTLGVADHAPDDRFVMWECRNPNRPVWQHFLVDNENDRRLRVDDRQLGRWFVRIQAVPGAPLPISADTLFVPLELRLPRVLERVLTLSSGEAPELRRYISDSPFSRQAERRRFQIPAPPEQSVDWLAFRPYCTGNFCSYPGSYGTAVWPRGEPLPMLSVIAASARGF